MECEKLHNMLTSKTNDAEKLLLELQKYLETQAKIDPCEISWGSIGRMGYFIQELSELSDWAYKRGKYSLDQD